MNTQHPPLALEVSSRDERLAQMRTLCHFVDVFASADPAARDGASYYSERLRKDGCDGEEIIKIAATALLFALEHEIDLRTRALDGLSAIWRAA